MMYPQPHTGSYYAATVNDVTNFAPLRGEHTADVCVIGAGFTGISAALHLAERGYNVHVIEANKVGWGASGRNGGQMIGGIAGEKHVAKHHGRDVEDLFAELRWAGHNIIRERVRKYEIQCDLKQGYVDVALKQSHMRDFEADYERLRKAEFPHEVRLLSRDETRAMTGTDTYIGALLNMGNGHLHPLNLCIGEARAAVSQGATIYEQSPVVAIDRGSRPRAVTENGSVKADAIVIAGNAYHHLERKLRGIMFPVNSFIVATEPLSVNYFGDDPKVIEARHRKKITRHYPQLSNIRIDYAWGGKIGVPINRVPLLGRISPNIFYSQGYSGHGVNVTHLVGQIMADAITGTMERFDLFANVKPFIVPGAHTFSTPMVALGVLYYKIRDRL
jgi:glycine/D-amino acid oxidase-like deaminating enzyme